MRPDPFLQYVADPTREHFRILVEKMRARVRLIVWRVVRDDHVADDLAQAVFGIVFAGEWDSKKIRSGVRYLGGVAYRTACEHVRRERRLREAMMRSDELETAAAAESFASDDRLDVRDAVSQLPEKLRRCVQMRYFLALDAKEIAAALNVTPRAVHYQLEAAHRQLRGRLGKRALGLLLPALSLDFVIEPVGGALAAGLDAVVALHPVSLAAADSSTTASSPSTAASTRAPQHTLRHPRTLRLGTPSLVAAGAGLLAVVACLTASVFSRGDSERTAASATPASAHGEDVVAPRDALPSPELDRVAARRGADALLGGWRQATRRLHGIDWRGLLPSSLADAAAPIPDDEDATDALATMLISVVDEDGRPIERGTVYVMTTNHTLSNARDDTPGEGRRLSIGKRVVRDRIEFDGTNPIRIDLTRPEELEDQYFVSVIAPGYPELPPQPVPVKPGKRNLLLVTIDSRRAATVEVRDAVSGAPILGALVYALRDDWKPGDFERKISSIAGPDGRCVLRGFDERPYVFVVRAHEHADAWIGAVDVAGKHAVEERAGEMSAPAKPLVVWLHSEPEADLGTLDVEVFDSAGRRVADTEVWERGLRGYNSQRTDANGACTFAAERSGFHEFESAPERGPDGREVVLSKRVQIQVGKTARMTLGSPPETTRLVIRAVDPSGRPLVGSRIRLQGPAIYGTRTDAAGDAVFERVAAGRYDVILVATDRLGWFLIEPLEVPDGDGVTVRRECVFGRTTMNGWVVTRDGVPGDVTITLPGDRIISTILDHQGHFTVPGARPGTYHIEYRVERDRSPIVLRQRVEVRDGEESPLSLLAVDALGYLVVRVSDAAGRAVTIDEATCERIVEVEADAEVGADRAGDDGERARGAPEPARLARKHSGARASELHGLLEPGEYVLRVRVPGAEAIERRVRITAGATEEFDLHVR